MSDTIICLIQCSNISCLLLHYIISGTSCDIRSCNMSYLIQQYVLSDTTICLILCCNMSCLLLYYILSGTLIYHVCYCIMSNTLHWYNLSGGVLYLIRYCNTSNTMLQLLRYATTIKRTLNKREGKLNEWLYTSITSDFGMPAANFFCL